MKMKKEWMLWTIAVLGTFGLVLGVYQHLVHLEEEKATYVMLSDGERRAKIPEGVVRANNCDIYRAWASENFLPSELSGELCPFVDPTPTPVAIFNIGGLTFHIPRSYLYLGSGDPSGDVRSIYLVFKYPKMTPGVTFGKARNYDVNVTLYESKCYQYDVPCLDEGQNNYEIKCLKDPHNTNIIKKLYELKEEKLTAYEINDRTDMLVRGDPTHPDYWLHCASGAYEPNGYHPHCTTVFNHTDTDKVFIKTHFSRQFLLNHHDDIRQKVIEKLREFQQPF